MKGDLNDRALTAGAYIVSTGDTVRGAAARLGVSKSTVYKDVTARLPALNKSLAGQVQRVLGRNKAERHLRGGLATRERWQGRRG